MFKRRHHLSGLWLIGLPFLAATVLAGTVDEATLAKSFSSEVRPFLENYCLKCHDADTKKADLDLGRFDSVDSVLKDYPYWELVLERLQNGDMPPPKSKQQPSPEGRHSVMNWIEQFRRLESLKYAGDPGAVPARRLSNAEYDYTIHDLTGVDIRPTRSFPIDPANQAGFDNSGESLATSPALVKKYFEAAREVADHLVLLPRDFTFAPHPVVADTDRDKWGVFRIVDFYRKQPTDFADYFLAAWRYEHRQEIGEEKVALADVAKASGLSAKYLEQITKTLTDQNEKVGPIARVQALWRELPRPGEASIEEIRAACQEMRDYVVRVRSEIIPEVKNLNAPPIQIGAQALVLWKDRQMAANRRKFDPAALRTESAAPEAPTIPASTNAAAAATSTTNTTAGATASSSSRSTNAANTSPKRPQRHVQAPTPQIVQKGGFSFAPTLVTRESSATAQMAASKKRSSDPELVVPEDPAQRAEYEAAFARFADVFPDAFYITERGRVYMDAEKEQENAGRLLSAGFHSMTGYFRDDGPLYDLILDDAARAELDRLWAEFDFAAAIPQRMHTSLLWFERTDSAFLRDPEFDPYRPEDKSALSQEKIRQLGALYLAKAQKNNASDTAQQAIREHFAIVAANIDRVERARLAAVPSHLHALERFAERAYRRPLSAEERRSLRDFYDTSRKDNGLDHEDAMRDCIVRVLLSPHFSFRMDLVEAAGKGPKNSSQLTATRPLSSFALASRLSYFLWASLPDDELRAHAAAGDLSDPKVLLAQAHRLLRDPRVKDFATEFGGNWLDFRRFEQHNSVDRERFPSFNNELRSAMFEEPIHFLTDVAAGDRSILDLLYAPDTFVNPVLAKFYGMTVPTGNSNDWTHISDARAFGRGGLLPMSVFLTANSPGLRTSPVKRGNWVVKRILGERIPPPPATVPQLPADEKKLGNLTLREALASHRDNPACAGCHARFDSFGLVFESFGPVGERREKDLGGREVDTHADFPGGGSGDGLAGLLEYIRSHRERDFVNNFCRKLLAYALGRTLILSDEPLVEEMQARLAKSDHRFSTLVDCIVSSPQFLLKRDYDKLAKQ